MRMRPTTSRDGNALATAIIATVTLLGCLPAHAASPIDTVKIDLNPLIDAAAASRDRFAVEVPHRVSSQRDGTWSHVGARDTWDLTVRVPTAVSLSFHASRVVLPSTALLKLTAAGVTYTYTPAQIHGSELWSRLGKGDTLALQLSVDHVERSQAILDIAAFQAGYKAIGPGTSDHPRYAKIQSRLNTLSGSCTENYECHVGAGIDGPGQATVALLIANMFECSGTLVNDVPNDGAQYVLTARHCQTGQLGGGNPAAASSVVVYWDATTACGTALQSIFDVSARLGSGQSTVVEQQDVWLIRLSSSLPNDAYLAGWDATGAAITGGYTIDHALADTKQYVAWSGTAVSQTYSATDLHVNFSTTFWDVVNSVGSIDRGASGSGLFSAANQLVGTLSLGTNQCPVSPPPTPSTATAVANFNSLASVWNSTADTTSSTGATTLASVLDPGNTGTLSLQGAAQPVTVVLQASSSQGAVGIPDSLAWSSNGQSCTASGGAPGDGWTGTLAPNGSISIQESSVGSVTYGISCTGTGRAGQASATIAWSTGPAFINLQQPTVFPIYVGQMITLSWPSLNVSTCSASGGGAGDGWSGSLPTSGSRQVFESSAGTYQYTLTCTDSGGKSYSQVAVAPVQALSAKITLLNSPTTMLLGQSIAFSWNGTGPCKAIGGASGDGWAGPLTGNLGNITVAPTVAGTYTYTLSCGPGSIQSTDSVALTFTSGPPTATLSTSAPTQQTVVGASGLAPDNLSWQSNVQPCSITYAGPESGTVISNYPAIGSVLDLRSIAGTYTYTLTCGSGATLVQNTATIAWTQPPPNLIFAGLLAPTVIPVILGQGVQLQIFTNVPPCVGSGGAPGDGWSGPQNSIGGVPITINEAVAGTYTYTITCGVGPYATSQATVVFDNPGGALLTIASSNASPYFTQSVTLSWNSQVSPCTAYERVGSDGWSGPQPSVGTFVVTEAGPYQNTYTLTCGSGAQAVEAQTTVTWGPPPSPTINLTWSGAPSGIATDGTPVTLTWTGLDGESCTANGGVPGDGWAGARSSSGTFDVTESQPGQIVYGMVCSYFGHQVGTAIDIPWMGLKPTVTLSASLDQVTATLPVKLTWSATNATDCAASIGGTGSSQSAWRGTQPLSGSMTVTESIPGTYQYVLTCNDRGTNNAPPSPPTTVTATVTYLAIVKPTVSLTSSAPSVAAGASFQLNWTSSNDASCTGADAAGVSSTDGWPGQKTVSGSQTITESSPGMYQYSLSCSDANNLTSASSSVTVTITASNSGGSSGGGGGGGGGSMNVRVLAMLLFVLMCRSCRTLAASRARAARRTLSANG